MAQASTAIYKLLVRELHLDTFGHMNNAMYLSILEEARWQLITERGYSLKEIQRRGQGPVILEVNLKFLKELKLREEIEIHTSLIDYPGKVGRLKQEILNSKGELSAEAVFTLALFDLKERKIIEPTPEWRKAVGLDV